MPLPFLNKDTRCDTTATLFSLLLLTWLVIILPTKGRNQSSVLDLSRCLLVRNTGAGMPQRFVVS